MGCDIHSFAEVKGKNNEWKIVKNHFSLDSFDMEYYKKNKGDNPFDWRSYAMFGFLADVRNYSHCTPISKQKGLPDDISEEIKKEYEYWNTNAHSCSYLTLKELSDFDYKSKFEDLRTTTKTINKNGGIHYNGAALAEKGQGINISYKEHLGGMFFTHLEELKTLGKPEDVRIVFWFDN